MAQKAMKCGVNYPALPPHSGYIFGNLRNRARIFQLLLPRPAIPTFTFPVFPFRFSPYSLLNLNAPIPLTPSMSAKMQIFMISSLISSDILHLFIQG